MEAWPCSLLVLNSPSVRRSSVPVVQQEALNINLEQGTEGIVWKFITFWGWRKRGAFKYEKLPSSILKKGKVVFHKRRWYFSCWNPSLSPNGLLSHLWWYVLSQTWGQTAETVQVILTEPRSSALAQCWAVGSSHHLPGLSHVLQSWFSWMQKKGMRRCQCEKLLERGRAGD